MDGDDPLTRAMRPPNNETAQEKILRLQAEQEAARTSLLIDQELRAERAQIKKDAGKVHKILLLGESCVPYLKAIGDPPPHRNPRIDRPS